MNGLRIACPACRKRLLLKDQSKLGQRVKCPKCGERFVARQPAEPSSPPRDPSPSPPAGDSERSKAPHSPSEVPPASGEVVIRADPDVRVQELIGRGKRQRKSSRLVWVIASAVLLVAVLGGLAIMSRSPSRPAATPQADANRPIAGSVPDATPAQADPVAGGLMHPEGEPIRLFMVPSGARVIVHFRPSELWGDDERMSELRASLTQDVVAEMERILRELVNREPRQIESVLFAWILGARGTEPQRAAVVQLAAEERLSDLIDEFGGEPLDEFAQPKVYLHGDRAVLIHDRQTLAFAPRELAWELADWVETPNLNTSDGILALLDYTDRGRLLTVLFEPEDLLQHRTTLFPASLQYVAGVAATWFEANAETVGWSVDAGDEFAMELLVRGHTTQSSSTVAVELSTRFKELPPQMVDVVRAINPRPAGFRRIIGRFPAMLEVVRRATLSAVGNRLVRLSSVLPPKAGPNLVLATVLTWDQAQLRDPSVSTPRPSAGDAAPAAMTLTERLQRPLDAEFNRTPLQEAMDYIAGEAGVSIEIDGDALKDAGYTKNMPQTFNLGRIPAGDALREILRQYQEPGKEMVLVLLEPQQRILVSTKKFAEQNGQTPHDLGL